MTLTSDDRNRTSNDMINGAEQDPNVFNKYVNPMRPESMWDANATKTHGLLPSDPRISNADTIDIVWRQFEEWIDQHIPYGKYGIVVAWNGATCDLKWIWKLTQAPGSRYNMPVKLKYFMDPYRVIEAYSSCPINKKRSKLDSYELGCVWKYLDSKHNNLNGAHDSLVDAKAQTDIIVHQQFVPFINRSKSILLVDNIFAATQQNEWKKKLEPVREVHPPWMEQTKQQHIKWEPSWQDSYGGPEGGPKAGPSQYIIRVARSATSLADIFMAIVPMSFFVEVARLTTKYCYEDWVVEKSARDLNGNTKKRKYQSTCTESTEGVRHRGDKLEKKFDVTPGFIIAWIGILMMIGAHSGAGQRSTRKYWRSPPHGLALPYVMNTMSRSAFEFLRRYIHFADNNKANPKGTTGYDPLFKVKYVLDVMMNGMKKYGQRDSILQLTRA